MSKKNSLDEKYRGARKLSKKQLQEKARPYASEAIDELVKLMRLEYSEKTVSSKLGAIKVLLSKVLPDLRAEDVKHSFDDSPKELLEKLLSRVKDDNPTDSKSPI